MTALQTSSLEIPDSDALLMIEAIRAVQVAPELRLVTAEFPEKYETGTTRSE